MQRRDWSILFVSILNAFHFPQFYIDHLPFHVYQEYVLFIRLGWKYGSLWYMLLCSQDSVFCAQLYTFFDLVLSVSLFVFKILSMLWQSELVNSPKREKHAITNHSQPEKWKDIYSA